MEGKSICNDVGTIDNDERVVEGSLLSTITRFGSPPLQEHNNTADIASEHYGDEGSLLGLRLNKIELLEMVQKEFAQDDIKAKGICEPTVASLNASDSQSSITMLPQKPSKFHAYILRIGLWQWTSKYEGDLVVRFYYAYNKLVWEIIDGGLKRKIEINWEDISALKVTCPDGGPGILEIMLFQKPSFFRETNLQPGRNTTWQIATDFTGGQASIHRRHVLQCAPEILNKHIVKLISSNHRLNSLFQEEINFQQDLYFGGRHSEFQVPESYGNQWFWGYKFGEKVPISVGTNIGGRNQNESQNGMSILNASSASGHSLVATGAPLGGLEQHRNMFNWCTTSLQKHPQKPCLEQWCSEPEILDSSNAQDLYRFNGYQQFVGPQFRETVPMSTGTNIIARNHNGWQDDMPIPTPCSDLGRSSGVTGGLEQHRNMFNWRPTSMETLRPAQLNFSSGRASVFTETTSGGLQLQQQQHRNVFSCSSSSSLQTPPRQAQLNIVSRGTDDAAANYMVNPRKRPNLLTSTSMGASANYSGGSSSQSMRELESSNRYYAFNDTTTQQTFKQKQNDGSATMEAMVLEKISHDLLDEIDLEPTDVADDAMVMSTMNSLSSLLQQDPATGGSSRSQSSNAQASDAGAIAPPLNAPAEAATQLLLSGVDPDAGSGTGTGTGTGTGGGSNNSLLLSASSLMGGKPWEMNQR